MDIRTLVDEIISLDPSLASRRVELEQIVSQMVSQKPDIAVDETFLSQLRLRLVSLAATQAPTSHQSFLSLITPRRLVVASVLGSIVFGLSTYTFLQRPQSPSFARQYGFGSFAVAQLPTYESTQAMGATVDAIASSASIADTSTRTQSGGGSAMNMAKMMIYPPIEDGQYGQYTFTVPDIASDLPDALPVYGYVKNPAVASDVDRAVSDVWRSIFGKKSARVTGQTVSGIVDIDGALYSVYVDGQRGVAQISFVYPPCTGSACDELYRPLDAGSKLAEDQIVDIAQTFLDTLDIQTDMFGSPRVVSPLVYTIMNEVGSSVESIADTVDVLYPITLPNDASIVDYSGVSAVGLRVSVSVRTQQVISISELPLSTLAQSSYEVISDVERIRALAEMGGQYGVWGTLKYGSTLALGEPSFVYTSVWKTDESGMNGQTVYVPAYRFQILYPEGSGETQYLQQFILIPLEKELFEQAERDAKQRGSGEIYPIPMPFVRTTDGGVSEGNEGQMSESAPAVESLVVPRMVE